MKKKNFTFMLVIIAYTVSGLVLVPTFGKILVAHLQ